MMTLFVTKKRQALKSNSTWHFVWERKVSFRQQHRYWGLKVLLIKPKFFKTFLQKHEAKFSSNFPVKNHSFLFCHVFRSRRHKLGCNADKTYLSVWKNVHLISEHDCWTTPKRRWSYSRKIYRIPKGRTHCSAQENLYYVFGVVIYCSPLLLLGVHRSVDNNGFKGKTFIIKKVSKVEMLSLLYQEVPYTLFVIAWVEWFLSHYTWIVSHSHVF